VFGKSIPGQGCGMGKVSNAACCLLDTGDMDGPDHVTSLLLTCNTLSQHVASKSENICTISL